MKTALIPVDLQNDFMPKGALGVKDGDITIALANMLAPNYGIVVPTQDWHPPGHCSFEIWPVHCVQNTWGAEFADGLERTLWKKIFQKGQDPHVDSYSGFFDNDHKSQTGLGDYLHEQEVELVDVMGLATDFCVRFTAEDARALGYKTRLLAFASRPVFPDKLEGALAEIEANGVEVIRTIEEWKASEKTNP